MNGSRWEARRFAGPAVLLVALAACAGGIDEDQARRCRLTLPVLNGPNARIDVTGVARHALPRTLVVTYTVDPSHPRRRERKAICRFAAADRLRLEALATESGPVADATLYFLQRFYLGTREAELADPGARR